MKAPHLQTARPPARTWLLLPVLAACLSGEARAAEKETSSTSTSTAPVGTKAEGSWKWNFTMPDGTKVSPRAKLKREGNILTGKASVGAGSEIDITDGRIDGDQMSWKVIREHADQKVTTRYSAKISGNSAKGTIESNWSGEVQVYPWEPRRASDSPTGTWRWEMIFGRGSGGGAGGGRGGGFRLDMRMKLKLEEGKLSGKISSRGGGTDITNASFENGKISFEVERERSDGSIAVTKYSGKLDGDTIKGKMEFEMREELQKIPWEATRQDE